MKTASATFMHKRPRGFTLLELLLSIGVLFLLLGGLYEIFDSWAKRAINRTVAQEMLRVQNAAQDYALVNFETFKTDRIGQFVEIPIADLSAFNYLPAAFEARNAFKQSIRTFRRAVRVARRNGDGTFAVDAGGNPVFVYNIEVLTASDDPAGGVVRAPLKHLLDAAQAGGPRLGVIAADAVGGLTLTGRVTSVFGQWWVPLADLAGADAPYTATPSADAGGYIAAYGRVTPADTEPNDQWLYRVEITGRPELNRMATDLRMNNNRIENVGSLVADRVAVTGNAAFRGLTQGTTNESAQAMTVEQAMRVDGTFVPGNTATENRINMKATGGGCSVTTDGAGNRSIVGAGCTASGGEIQVVSAAGDADLVMGGLTSAGSAITDITAVNGLTDARGLSTFSTLTNTGNLSATNRIIAPTTNVLGANINTEQMQAATVNVTAPSSVTGALVAASIKPGVGRSVTTPNLEIANTANLTGNVQAAGLDVTRSTYIRNVGSGAGGTYRDTRLGNRAVTCTDTGTYTYCEPSGTYTWPNGDEETCNGNGNGYTCRFVRGGAFIGECVYTRAVNAVTRKAFHTVSCS